MVSFLSPTDAVTFSEQFPNYGVNISRLEPEVVHRALWSGDRVTGDEPVCSNYRLPVLKGVGGGGTSGSSSIHSAVLRFRWRDQGWGNRKGGLYIVASTTQQQNNAAAAADAAPLAPFRGGRVVCETADMAPHAITHGELTFVPRESENYTLWYRCGAGGGHQLHLEDCTLRLFIFDDAERHWARNYQRLHELGVIGAGAGGAGAVEEQSDAHQIFHQVRMMNIDRQPPRRTSDFYPKMLLRVCQSLRRQLAAAAANNITKPQLDADLVEFLREYSIPLNEASLRSVQEIVHADLGEQRAIAIQQQEAQRRAAEMRGDHASILAGFDIEAAHNIQVVRFPPAADGQAAGPPAPVPAGLGAALNNIINRMMGGAPDDNNDGDDSEASCIQQ